MSVINSEAIIYPENFNSVVAEQIADANRKYCSRYSFRCNCKITLINLLLFKNLRYIKNV